MRFAIITPTIGRDSLRSALLSVKSQTFASYVHLVIGDGPQQPYVRHWCDSTGARYLELPESGKCWGAKARDLGMETIEKEALADYVVFLDDDNIFFPTALERYEKSIRALMEPAMLFQKVVFHNQFNDGWLEVPRSMPPKMADWDSLNACYRSDVVAGMRWECDYNHDYLLAQQVIDKTGEQFHMVDGYAGVHF